MLSFDFVAHNAGLGREDISVEDLRPTEAVERVLHRLRELKQDGLPELRVDAGFGRFGLECRNCVLASLKKYVVFLKLFCLDRGLICGAF